MGHRKGRRKRARDIVERALDVEHKKYCPICGERVTKMSPDNPCDREIFTALESGKCPRCGGGLKVTDEGILYCSKRCVCRWCVYVVGLGRR